MNNKLLNALIFWTVFYVPNILLAQPTLGTAANYILFTTTGAVSNTGISQYTGNVGTNNGAIAGFGNVDGQMHNGDGSSAAAAADLLNAYNQIEVLMQTASHAVLLGGGETLNAGVYQLNGGVTLNLVLTLDGQGDPNAVFVFRIDGGTFSSTANAEVVLINGAKACNVFWSVEGAVNIGSGTKMKGTIIANNAALDLNSGVTLEGRALSTTGAVMATNTLAYMPLGCGVPILTGPTAPALASTACYALFSSSGLLANSGVTNVTGDIGTNFGTASGYNPVNVTGTIHATPDASTATCATDLTNVYTSLNALPHDIELLYPAQFGNDLVLTPHTYLLTGPTVFTKDLYLNAQDNVDAVFVLKFNGAVSTSPNARIILTNGALAKNVYWVVEGALNIGLSSTMKGTIVVNGGEITLNDGTILDGRAMTRLGNINTTNNTVNTTTSCTVLPVNWLYVRGKAVNKAVLIEWGTANEKNNAFYVVERSSDGKTFEKIGKVIASKTVSSTYNYAFTDPNPYNIGYYRIAQTDNDGRTSYNRIIEVDIDKGLKISHYVNEKSIYIQSSGYTTGNKGTIELFTVDGKLVASKNVNLTQEIGLFSIDKPTQTGIYLIKVQSIGEAPYVGKVMIMN